MRTILRVGPVLFVIFLNCSPVRDALAADDESGKVREIPNIVVVGIKEDVRSPGVELDAKEHQGAPAVDGAELLRSVNGISLGRFGGRGLEPSIRGQNQGRINVLIDGSYVHGGCPNRMDPPTSFASVNSYERITVLKGVQTLRYGGGGSGGTLLFERDFEPGQKGFSGRLQLGASDNHLKHDVAAGLAFNANRAWMHLDFEDREAGNYEDGDGDEVRSAWHEQAGNLSIGFRFREQDRLEFGYEHSKTVDAFYPGAGMDAPRDEARHGRFRYTAVDVGPADQLTLEAYRADVEHEMDNFSNRPLTAPMAMRVDSVSDTEGVRLVAELTSASGSRWIVGFDRQSNNRDATRLMGPDGIRANTVNSYMWPGAEREQLGIFTEAAFDLADNRLLRAGLRYDRVSAEAKKADLDPPPPPLFSPNQLYGMYYGARHDGAVTENNWGALLRLEQALDENWTLFGGISRTLRTADATERFLAANNPNPMQRWIGNPKIEPERHHQLDVGFVWHNGTHRVDTVIYHDAAQDYILRDRAHAQAGILKDDSASIYRNVDARISGIETEWRWSVSDSLAANSSLAYTRARNESDGRVIAQTPPLSGRFSLRYERQALAAAIALRWAGRQTRVDTDPATGSGLDPAGSSGWAVLDLSLAIEFDLPGTLRAGIDNVFDRTYAEHLNRGNLDPFNPDPVRVNEPGRVLWTRYEMSF